MRATWWLWPTLGLAGVAYAVDVDPLDTSGSTPHDSGSPSVESPALSGKGLSAGAMAHVSEDLVTQTDGDQTLRTVPHVFATTIYGGWTFEDKLRVEAFLPVYWHTRNDVSGDDPFGGAGTGDLVLQSNIRLRQNESGTFGVSLIPALGIPTGRPKALLARGAHLKLKAAIGGEFRERFGYAANLGFVVGRGRVFEEVAVGSGIRAGAAGWVRLQDRFRVGADYDALIGTSNAPGDRNVLGQANLFAQVTNDSGFGLTAGVGRGLVVGVGAPRYKVFAALTYAQLVRDTDKDGLLDPDDTCPLDPEDIDQFQDEDGCPDVDNDEDGILDLDDDCMMEAEDFDAFEDVDGCPDPDNDQDGLLDEADACMYRAGDAALAGCPDSDGDTLADDSPLASWPGWEAVVEAGYEGPTPIPLDQCPADPGPTDLAGCPDSDADLVPDYRDACPDVQRLEDEPPERSNGCPKTAFVQGDRVTITERVLFETNRATIRPESFGLLDTVVEVMADNPQLLRMQVAGHTDNVGSERTNLRLSQRRAKAVLDYLVNKGIEATRLESEGYGEAEPIDVNFTEAGRQANRRVEFRILEQEEVTEEVETKLGADVGGLTVKMPAPYALLEIDQQAASPRAPVRSLILPPGGHIVRVRDPRRALDYTTDVTIEAGSTAVVEIPADAISEGVDLTPEDLQALPTIDPAEVTEGQPLAVPVEGEGDTEPVDGEMPTEGEPTESTPPTDEPEADPPVDVAPEGDAGVPDAVETPEPPETTPAVEGEGDGEGEAPDAGASEPETDVWGMPIAPADPELAEGLPDPDAFPVEDAGVLPAEDPAVDDGPPTLGEASDEVISGPGFGTVGPAVDSGSEAETETGPGFGAVDGESTGPGFGTNVAMDPKEAKKRAKAEAKAAKKAAKEAEKARKKAEKDGDAPPPLLDPSTLPQ